MTVFNPRILDACTRDVVECLPVEQKAEILMHAMNLLKLTSHVSRHLVENGVQSCLQVDSLASSQLINALLLRGRARMAAGEIKEATEDLQSVLNLEPGNHVATSLLSMPNASELPKSRLWGIQSGSRQLSPEIWRQIASCLPRRDLKTLLHIPHVLSRISFEFVFEVLDFHLGACVTEDESHGEWVGEEEDGYYHRDLKLEKYLAQRTADIIARIMIDPGFSRLVRKLRIFASPHHRCDHMVFQTAMLSIALPRLINLRHVSFAGSNEVACKIAEVLATIHPNIRSLSLEPMVASHVPHLPQLTNLTKFSYVCHSGNHSVSTFLAQNRSTLRELQLSTCQWTFPDKVVTLQNLTHLQFFGTFPASSTTIGDILSQGVNLESLRLQCVLHCNPSDQFKDNLDALPRLRAFGFSVTDGSIGEVDDPTLFPTIAEFIRNHPSLEKLELSVPNEQYFQMRVGYDASIMGALPSVPLLRHLDMSVTEDLAPGLASWLIPRKTTSLSLSGLPRRDPYGFLHQMRAGIPTSLRFVGLDGMSVRDFAQVVESSFPTSVRLARLNYKYFTVRWKTDGGLEMEEWPERRAQLHMGEWLESLGCEDVAWNL
ncbi:hypothetical protein BD410DRAFT_783287 [Rickenella mellea]|uniref:Uncharacterized protein n=1 Tax=Rickenella mellea TaxID=50990 RepID=A0A4Y7QJM7_9AGAM|nr:hypothetical protein BD410DRAFT_783287 [Rickenella mellea]